MFTAIGCAIGLWLLCKWGDRDTPYYKSQIAIKNQLECERSLLQQQLAAGIIDQEKYDELFTIAHNKSIRKSIEDCIRKTQIGCKDFKFDDK